VCNCLKWPCGAAFEDYTADIHLYLCSLPRLPLLLAGRGQQMTLQHWCMAAWAPSGLCMQSL
jgi:hypothetical protein